MFGHIVGLTITSSMEVTSAHGEDLVRSSLDENALTCSVLSEHHDGGGILSIGIERPFSTESLGTVSIAKTLVLLLDDVMNWDVGTLEPFEEADVSSISFRLVKRVISHLNVASCVEYD